MRGFAVLHMRYLARRAGRASLAVAAVAAATTLAMALICVQGSLTSSVNSFETAASAGADLEVSGLSDTGINEGLLPRIASAPGVAAATPLLLHEVVVNHRPADLVGADPSIVAFGGAALRRLAAEVPANRLGPENLVVGSGLASYLRLRSGSALTVFGGGTEHRAVAADILPGGAAAEFDQGQYALTALPYAQSLAGMTGRVDTALVRLAPHASVDGVRSELTALVGQQASVESPAQLVRDGTTGFRDLQGIIPVISMAVLLVALFLVFNTVSMLALERRRELATLRALGARRRSLLAGFMAQAGVLGAVGSAIGIGVGALLGRWLVDGVPPFLLSAIPGRVSFHVPLAAPLAAAGAGIAGSLVAAWMPGRRAVAVAPVEAMRPDGAFEGVDEALHYRWVLTASALALMGAGATTLWLWPRALSALGAGALVVGWILFTYGIGPALVSAAARLASIWGRPGRLASASLGRSPRRVWGTVAAVAAAVALVVGLSEVASNARSSVNGTIGSLGRPALWIQTAPPNSLPNHLLMPQELEGRLSSLPGVAGVRAGQLAYATYGGNEILLEGLQAGSADPMFVNASPEAKEALSTNRGAIVSTQIAAFHRLRVGDPLTLDTPIGPRTLPVTAVVVTFIWPQGAVALPLSDVRDWYQRPGASWYEVTQSPGADVGSIRADAVSLVGSASYPVYVATGREYLAGASSSINGLLQLLVGLDLIALGVAGLAVLNTLVISVVGRRRELGVLRAVGSSRIQLSRTLVVEAISMAAIGVALGVPFGILFQALGIRGGTAAQGLPITFQVVALPVAAAAAAAVAMSLAGSWWPARRSGRVNVIAAIGYE
jgi:putative ABC transport system permease protein